MYVTNTGRIGALPGQNIDMRRLLQYSIKKYGIVTVDNYGNLYESFKDTSRAWSRFTHTFSETSKYIQLLERESVRSISTDKRKVLKRKLRELMIGLSGVDGLDNPVDEEGDVMDGTNSSFVRETASQNVVSNNVIDTTIVAEPTAAPASQSLIIRSNRGELQPATTQIRTHPTVIRTEGV